MKIDLCLMCLCQSGFINEFKAKINYRRQKLQIVT